uniref:Uncharacterized protein n=1 Tax=Arundo donax TaxID=35708 RepID=A0A0A9GTN9_ARUDO
MDMVVCHLVIMSTFRFQVTLRPVIAGIIMRRVQDHGGHKTVCGSSRKSQTRSSKTLHN